MKVLSQIRDSLRRKLIVADSLEKADLIFVLAGHTSRKVYAVRLFRDAWAPQLLVSTSDPPYIARLLERELALRNPESEPWASIHKTATLAARPEDFVFASLDAKAWAIEKLPYMRLGTLREIVSLGAWLRRRPLIRSVLIVSLGMHLKRVRLCCQRLLPPDRKLRFIAVPEHLADLRSRTETARRAGLNSVLLECVKVALYSVLLAFWPSERMPGTKNQPGKASHDF
ncbi:MAG TPA: hypothetical protein VKW78_03765 [Terriglobales bacterium]|nr:hypothetical protein [Terriglobales bacterium]HZR63927.1 hypothetical protein [Terriglobales bacterium]